MNFLWMKLYFFFLGKWTRYTPCFTTVNLIRIYQCRYDREEETTFFFWDFYLFEVIFLFICWWFPNNFKRKCVADFAINYLWNCQKSGKRSKRAWFCVNFFRFQVFETFGNLVITDFSGYLVDFSVSEQLPVHSKLQSFFVKTSIL